MMLFTLLINGNNMAEMEQSLGCVVNGDVIYHEYHTMKIVYNWL